MKRVSIDNWRALARRDTEVHLAVTVWPEVKNMKAISARIKSKLVACTGANSCADAVVQDISENASDRRASRILEAQFPKAMPFRLAHEGTEIRSSHNRDAAQRKS